MEKLEKNTREEYKCQPLYVDNWKEPEVEDCETGEIKIEDTLDGEEIMEEKESEKYLGDIISKDGRNLKNIQARVNSEKNVGSYPIWKV